MFGASKEREAKERALKKERESRERNEFWGMLLDKAKDDNERTRLFIDHRLETLYEWLNDFDRRMAAEARLHARETQRLIVGFGVLLLLLHFWR